MDDGRGGDADLYPPEAYVVRPELEHGPPRHLISDQEGVFTGEAFSDLLRDWNIKHRFGAVGKHGSIAVTERLIWTLKHEWLTRVVLIRGLDHLGELLADFEQYYNEHRGHQRLGGATPAMVYRGQTWQKPGRSAKQVTGVLSRNSFVPQGALIAVSRALDIRTRTQDRTRAPRSQVETVCSCLPQL